MTRAFHNSCSGVPYGSWPFPERRRMGSTNPGGGPNPIRPAAVAVPRRCENASASARSRPGQYASWSPGWPRGVMLSPQKAVQSEGCVGSRSILSC
ncbi:hypothetical protein K438DRAFT_1819546 [Mycena galopus ATCC 62051]|nr:hypothetical protein K438DRAFT_1819546 [Mycena galopus ATCC 62051]